MQEKRFTVGNAKVYFWITENIGGCINNVEINKAGKTINIKEITGKHLGNQPDELYTLAAEQEGMLLVSTFRGINFWIDTENLSVVKKEFCK